jgi:hypothetical protein
VGFPPRDPLLARIQLLQQRGGIPVASEGATDWYEVMLFPPAREADVESTQAALGKRLPADFVRFWRFSNGANLFINESGLHGVGVASTSLLRELEQEEREHYSHAALERYAVFARVNGGGDFLVFDLQTGNVLDGVHAEQPHEWRPIAASFTHWLEQFVECGGKYFWLEALYAASPDA